MKLRDLVQSVAIDPRKLTDYMLNPENNVGQHKARVFAAALGYTQTNYQLLLQHIAASALEAEVTIQYTDNYGQHVRADLVLRGVSGQQAVVRTGWLIPPDRTTAQLTTAYVRKAR